MNPINPLATPAKPDIDHPSLKEGSRVVAITPPLLARERSEEMTTSVRIIHLGEKWESDKSRNKTQQLSHTGGHPVYIIQKALTYLHLTHLYDGYNPAILLYLPLSDFIKQTPIHA